MSSKVAQLFELRGLPYQDRVEGTLYLDQPRALIVVDGLKEDVLKESFLPQALVRMGPDKFLVVDEDQSFQSLLAKLNGLTPRPALVDVGHGMRRLVLRSTNARRVLNSGIAMNLSEAAFPAGSSAPTGFRDLYLLLHAVDATTFHLYTFRSFSESLFLWLKDALEAWQE